MGDIKYYSHISIVLFLSFLLNVAVIVLLNINYFAGHLARAMSFQKVFLVELFFWAALGATVACSLFVADDKEANELEACKKKPDPKVLRYPDAVNVQLYIQRIITSGILGVIGAFFLFAGFGYFDIQSDVLTRKHRISLVLTCFIIGLYQRNFLTTLAKWSRKLFEKSH